MPVSWIDTAVKCHQDTKIELNSDEISESAFKLLCSSQNCRHLLALEAGFMNYMSCAIHGYNRV